MQMQYLKSLQSDYSPANESIQLLGVKVWNGSMRNAVAWIHQQVKNRTTTLIGFANANNLNIAYEQMILRNHYQQCSRIFADGAGIKLAAKMSNQCVIDNVNGTDLFPLLCQALQKSGSRVYFLGAEPYVLNRMIEETRLNYPDLDIVGFHHGYISGNELLNHQVVKTINASKADLLVVAMGTPCQENWLTENLDKLKVPVKMSVGGLFDFIAGKNSRAPLWMRNSGSEWIWRIIQEPRRMWRRYILGNPKFVYRIFVQHTIKLKPSNLLDKLKIGYSKIKRLVDLLVTSLALILLIPLFIAVALAIKIESAGPVLYSQYRIGKNGRKFKFWKFRSMVANAHSLKKSLTFKNESSDNVLFKIKQDPRITRVGEFIRRFSIDELPQLWNVLRGDMSLVGPRPALPDEVAKYSQKDKQRLEVKPGLTCFWQIFGRSDLSFKQQVELDCKYIKERSVWVDLKIMLLTIPAVISGKGAY